jgi:hypothetical protein
MYQVPGYLLSIALYISIDVDCWDDGEPEPGSGGSGGSGPGNPNNGPTGGGGGGTWPNGGGSSGGSGGPSGGSGGYGSGGGGPFYPWWNGYDPNGGQVYSPAVDYLINTLGLTIEQANWLQSDGFNASRLQTYLQSSSNPQATAICMNHLDRLMNTSSDNYAQFISDYNSNNITFLMWWENSAFLAPFGGLSFGDWAINYLVLNPNLSFSNFKFLSIRKGNDGSFDSNYWDDPNLNFPPQVLPNWSDFNSNFPKHDDPLLTTPLQMYTSIGGQVLAQYNSNPVAHQNTCALRVSKGLNYSGITIPPGPDRFQGSDGKYYFLGAKALKILECLRVLISLPERKGGRMVRIFQDYLQGKREFI